MYLRSSSAFVPIGAQPETNPLLSPDKFTRDHFLKIKWLFANVTVVRSPDTVPGLLRRLLVDAFDKLLGDNALGEEGRQTRSAVIAGEETHWDIKLGSGGGSVVAGSALGRGRGDGDGRSAAGSTCDGASGSLLRGGESKKGVAACCKHGWLSCSGGRFLIVAMGQLPRAQFRWHFHCMAAKTHPLSHWQERRAIADLPPCDNQGTALDRPP